MSTVRWDVDDRRATLRTRLYVRWMRLARDKRAFEGEQHTLAVARKRQRSGDRPPNLLTRFRCTVATATVAGMTTWTVRPRSTPPKVRVIYLHGGGYVHPLTADYWRLVRTLTTVPAEVVVPAYPLAPGGTIDDVLPRLAALEKASDVDLPTVIMGDSAGGALTIVLACHLRDHPSRPHPVGLVALCPWLDATLAEDTVADLEDHDPMLAASGLRAAGRWWASPRSPADPRVSPLAGDLDGLPPLDVFIGDHDILRPAVDDLADHARSGVVGLHVHEVPEMFHVWMTRLLPEGRRTRQQLVQLVRRRALP